VIWFAVLLVGIVWTCGGFVVLVEKEVLETHVSDSVSWYFFNVELVISECTFLI